MKLQEFDKILSENEELREKFTQRRVDLLKQVKTEEEFPEKLSALIKELGYDVSAEELVLDSIVNKEIDDDELEKVAGGLAPWWCIAFTTCYTVLGHSTKNNTYNACWKDWQCLMDHRDEAGCHQTDK